MGETYLHNKYGHSNYMGFKYIAYILDNIDLRKEITMNEIYKQVGEKFNKQPYTIRKTITTYINNVDYVTPKSFIYDCYYDMKKI